MNTEPVSNDPNDPLISLLVYNYDYKYLEKCLTSIFKQSTLSNFEVILIDDATNDGSWEIALEFQKQFHRRITLNRNKRVYGPARNMRHGMQMAKGRYCSILTGDQSFIPQYVKGCVQVLGTDPYSKFYSVFRTASIDEVAPPAVKPFEPLQSIQRGPLVSILCYNFNYGRYLCQCLESVFAQTYENIELCFSDNASTDESWEIALEFAAKYPGKISLARNRKNFGPDDNFANCRRNMQGKYYINFCSDDVLAPEYVERCVSSLEANPNAGMAIVNRAILDQHGNRTEEAPFYNQSCVIPGEEQAAVYMMAGVNPSVSQIMYRQSIVDGRTSTGGLATRYYGTRILDFNISIDLDVVYLKDSLLLHRLHPESDTNQADSSLLPIIGMFVLNHQFADIASVRNLNNVTYRLTHSLEKLAQLSVRYSVRSLLCKDEQAALRYFHLAVAMHVNVVNNPVWKQLQGYFGADANGKSEIIKHLGEAANLAARSISYDPPAGSVPIFPLET
jgi:glycosyltransferase involved in cell wall biosynthesis